MPIWPSSLPAPTVSGYQLSPADQTVRSDMEVGAGRSRRRTAARNDQVSAAWVMTDEQFVTFRAWFSGRGADDANGGAAWVGQMPLALGDGGVTYADSKFIGPFSATLQTRNLRWYVTAKLEVR